MLRRGRYCGYDGALSGSAVQRIQSKWLPLQHGALEAEDAMKGGDISLRDDDPLDVVISSAHGTCAAGTASYRSAFDGNAGRSGCVSAGALCAAKIMRYRKCKFVRTLFTAWLRNYKAELLRPSDVTALRGFCKDINTLRLYEQAAQLRKIRQSRSSISAACKTAKSPQSLTVYMTK